MRSIIDFRQARFTECFENPYRITPPGRDTLYSKALADHIDFDAQGLSSHYNDTLKKCDLDTHIYPEQNKVSSAAPPLDSHSSSNPSPADEYPRITIREVQDSLITLFSQKKRQTSAFLDVVDAEINVIKSSIFATIFAGIAAVLVASVCWLMINALIGLGLYSQGIPVASSIFILLALNIILFTFIVYIVKRTSRYARFERIINVIKDL